LPKTVESQLSADRITVGLTRRSTDELDALQIQTGLSKTDLVNRAIGLYKFITDHLAKGDELLIRDTKGNQMVVHLQ
jgi:hypothetical protein